MSALTGNQPQGRALMECTTVVNLATDEQRTYSLPPKQAVVMAWRQEHGDHNTWQHADHPSLTRGRHTIACGDWCAHLEREDKMTALPRDDDGRLTAYAWPGGYPVYYVTADSGALCPDCARMAEAEGLAGDPADPQWYILAADINWEDADLYCDHCSGRIESAYGKD